MKVATFLVAFLGCNALVAGCGESSGGDGDGGSEWGEEPEVDWSKADPPDNIDITTCADITEEEDEERDGCSACCSNAGYSVSSFIYDDRCTCSSGLDDGRDTVCMTSAGLASLDGCESCCDTAGFTGYAFIGGSAGSCTCHGRSDSTVCAGSIAGSAGGDACSFCCVDRGFISSGYSNFGEEECVCIDR
jgi:hypothetical protein